MNPDQKTLNECPEKGPQKIINLDPAPDHCSVEQESFRQPAGRPEMGFDEECSKNLYG